jgi:hypothetical protein
MAGCEAISPAGENGGKAGRMARGLDSPRPWDCASVLYRHASHPRRQRQFDDWWKQYVEKRDSETQTTKTTGLVAARAGL